MNIVSFQLNLMGFTPQEEAISAGRKKLKQVYKRDPANNQQGLFYHYNPSNSLKGSCATTSRIVPCESK
jgi:hypothetical protein